MYSTAAPPPLAVSLRPSATACLSNRTSSSAYCPLPAALTPFATAVKASVTERRRGESESWVQIQDQTSEEALLSCCFFVSFPSARRPADSSCFTSFPFTSPEFHHRPARCFVFSPLLKKLPMAKVHDLFCPGTRENAENLGSLCWKYTCPEVAHASKVLL
ncbi:hypothetical protein ATANTOWER_014826 [Ataeniobius toweri]|uniref:Uncharacterized protein n=1 Tax=Ataeniobius toweri TaxID=208326 RepID=A0ABU7AYK3_9TELE|nr:hypothetical protein [Ataeniobius toweri]